MEELQGIVRSVLVMEPGQSPISTPQERVRVILEGIQGDSHAGLTKRDGENQVPNTRQVSLVSTEELAEIANTLNVPRLNPEWIGANLLIEGIPALSQLPHGTRLLFQKESILIIEEKNTPCTSAGRAVQAQYPDKTKLSSYFPKVAMGKRGLLAWVQQPGEIRVGDSVVAQLPG